MPTEHLPRRAATPVPRATLAPAADAAETSRVAAAVIQVAAFAVVLAALPYPTFELDRYTIPKELVLSAAAAAASLVCLASARRLTVFMVDALLGGFLLLSMVSALFATTHIMGAEAQLVVGAKPPMCCGKTACLSPLQGEPR